MNTKDLKTGLIVVARFGRSGADDATAPTWTPWQPATLYVQRRETPLPPSMQKRSGAPNVGDILTLVAQNKYSPACEYSQGDYQGNGAFLAEDYYLEIRDLI